MKKKGSLPIWYGSILVLSVGAGIFLREGTSQARAVLYTSMNVEKAVPFLRSVATDSFYHVYLSFDDGPLPGSEHIDSLVLAEQVPVSVFLVGHNISYNPRLDVYYKLYEANPFIHIYNHSFSHAAGHYRYYYNHPQNVLADIDLNQQYLQLHNKIVRLPGRNIWRIGTRSRNDTAGGEQAADLLMQKGYRLFGWDLEWQHNPVSGVPLQSVATMEKEIMSRLASGNTFTKNHIIILLHDEMFRRPWEEDQLKALIDTLHKQPMIVFNDLGTYPASPSNQAYAHP
jgi:peptidoglycan/xylan/chitin deacetylase (PgdA/CDA1 family)